MKAFSSAVWGMGTTVVYLLDDRIEVGVISTGFSEDLRRVAYRDVKAVVCWPSRRPRFLAVGAIFTLAGAGMSLAGLLGSGDAASITLLVFGAITGLLGGFWLFYGRLGSALEFRIDGVRSSIRGVVVGRKARHAFLDELAARIEERRRRVPG